MSTSFIISPPYTPPSSQTTSGNLSFAFRKSSSRFSCHTEVEIFVASCNTGGGSDILLLFCCDILPWDGERQTDDFPGPGSGGIMRFKGKGTSEQGGQHEAPLLGLGLRKRITKLANRASYCINIMLPIVDNRRDYPYHNNSSQSPASNNDGRVGHLTSVEHTRVLTGIARRRIDGRSMSITIA